MKYAGILGCLWLCCSFFTPLRIEKSKIVSPLASFSSEWNNSKYDAAYSAQNATYMTVEEREVLHLLNLVRMDPNLFEKTVVEQYPGYSGKTDLRNNSYFLSLRKELKASAPLKIFLANKFCYESAVCHAKTSGSASYVGHDRITADCKKASFYFGECISYGYNKPLDIVMALLIDDGVPSLGHRKNFMANFTSAAVSIQPHKTYRFNAVIDLAY